VAGEETVDEHGRAVERVMLGVRMREGITRAGLPDDEVARLAAEGLIEARDDRVVLTSDGRLLADAVVRRLAP
jgi:oxygen-independent coproporphyrinogen-3 oxidase